MKVFGIFRGFPGLGRVMAGISIMSELKAMGHETKAYSYLRGKEAINEHGLEFILQRQPTSHQIMALGINPIGEISEALIDKICSEKPDLIIIDGEPLFLSTLAMVYPREKIVSLLNPMDIYNLSLPLSSLKFLRMHYLSAGRAIIHGIKKEEITLLQNYSGCDILQVNTILRKSIIDMNIKERKKVVTILGGGCSNASDSFFEATLEMGEKVIEAAKNMREEEFVIYCNDSNLANRLFENKNLYNVKIVSKYTLPENMYSSAKVVLCRAGRNTLSEILYLNIPAVLMSTNGDFRSIEQKMNMEQVCALNPDRFVKFNIEESGIKLIEKIKYLISVKENNYCFVPGNQEAIKFVLG